MRKFITCIPQKIINNCNESNKIKDNETGRACDKHWREEQCIQTLGEGICWT